MGAYTSPGGGVLTIPIVADASANQTLTTMAAARDFLATRAAYSMIADLATFSQVRLVVRRLAGASAAGAVVAISYSLVNPNQTFTTGDWTDLASVSLVPTATVLDSGWIALPAAARINNIYLTPTMSGGDGAASPTLGSSAVFFK